METENAPTRLLLHIPGLHPELAGESLPSDIRFISPGLSGTDGEAFFVSEALPFDKAQAGACLNDLLMLGSQYANARDLASLAAEQEEKPAIDIELRAEMAAISRFETSGEYAPETSVAAKEIEESSAIAAQKALLLAWELERSVSELSELEERFSSTRELFEDSVGLVDEEALKELPGLDTIGASMAGTGAGVARMAWRTVFAAALRFAPDNAQWLSSDTELLSVVEECAEASSVQAPEGCVAWQVDAWKLLGHTRVPQEQPWLDKQLTIFAHDNA